MLDLEKLKYPIGKFLKPTLITKSILEKWISDISTFPKKLTEEVIHLTNEQLDTQYRPDGWTIRQVVHHCADSHMNSLIRLKLSLTENQPTIKPYFQERWAELPDSKMPIEPSLKMIEGIHERYSTLLFYK
jgi:hypothetical protein